VIHSRVVVYYEWRRGGAEREVAIFLASPLCPNWRSIRLSAGMEWKFLKSVRINFPVCRQIWFPLPHRLRNTYGMLPRACHNCNLRMLPPRQTYRKSSFLHMTLVLSLITSFSAPLMGVTGGAKYSRECRPTALEKFISSMYAIYVGRWRKETRVRKRVC